FFTNLVQVFAVLVFGYDAFFEFGGYRSDLLFQLLSRVAVALKRLVQLLLKSCENILNEPRQFRDRLGLEVARSGGGHKHLRMGTRWGAKRKGPCIRRHLALLSQAPPR